MPRLSSPEIPHDPLLKALAAEVADLFSNWPEIQSIARRWLLALREKPAPLGSVQRIMVDYPLTGDEGRALMRLVEALLRIPDRATALDFMTDQLARGRFDLHAVSAEGISKLSSHALDFAQKCLNARERNVLARWTSAPIAEVAAKLLEHMGTQFVFAHDISGAIKRAAVRKHLRTWHSFDMLGEGARTMADAQRYTDAYRAAISSLRRYDGQAVTDGDGISIKLSAVEPRYEPTHAENISRRLLPVLQDLALEACRANIHLTLDAEESWRLELSLDVLDALLARLAMIPETRHWSGLGIAVQTYQTRAPEVIDEVINLSRKYQRRLMVRLVKGAYWDSEIKRAQELGLFTYPVFTQKPASDLCYLACAQRMLKANDAIQSAFATHNPLTLAAIQWMAHRESVNDWEWQGLHGMGDTLLDVLDKDQPGLRKRIYAPVGAHENLLAYLVRRLLENGANTSFVRLLADPATPIDSLLTSPTDAIKYTGVLPAPTGWLSLENNQLGRPLARGMDMNDAPSRQRLCKALDAARQRVTPTADATAANLLNARSAAMAAWPAWEATPVSNRSVMLRKAADEMEVELDSWAADLVLEAHKAWPDAISEVREAVDFLRYYANEAERVLTPLALPGPTGETNVLRLSSRGPIACISPWNFPLAIFLGQVAAAVVCGNPVFAKPAEQTPRIAARAVRLLHRCGVPSDILHCLPGARDVIGEALLAAPEIAGVAFTGSVRTAHHLARALASKPGPLTPLIAETGGINVMIVDSTALLEQATDALIESAFRSAGQRCSATRLILVQSDVAEPLIELLQGAMAELHLGAAEDFATDVGPVIDAAAHANLLRQIDQLGSRAKFLAATPCPPHYESTHIAPSLWDIGDLAALKHVSEEIFGPVLQLARFSAAQWDELPDQINALGYGLTLGLQSRIDSRATELEQRCRVGNIYINRSTIGAVVGVQPFGGCGLSGTGFKAGGPNYLLRFCTERTLTINTAAAGGNADLISGAIAANLN
ncbi:MAG: bifunctional proline dehydrogenase/L-glutamate gamma-semialdehyde dehydrogenase PutA [Rhodocyclaceae bacterium]|nr:bifunctional proline dehydrogenase/L-glutamate gamma-semialdehyde dehydrogenase PutA [Rhodocyclaceae bacterium]